MRQAQQQQNARICDAPEVQAGSCGCRCGHGLCPCRSGRSNGGADAALVQAQSGSPERFHQHHAGAVRDRRERVAGHLPGLERPGQQPGQVQDQDQRQVARHRHHQGRGNTNTSPTAALFATNKGREAVFVAWKSIGGGGLSRIKYSDGVVSQQRRDQLDQAGDHAWTSRKYSRRRLRRPCCSRSTRRRRRCSSPSAVQQPRPDRDRHRGWPERPRFTWGTSKRKSAWISPRHQAEPTTTNAQPALTEILGADGNGTIYVFWKGLPVTPRSATPRPRTTSSTGLDGDATLTWTLQGQVPDSNGIGGLAQTHRQPGGRLGYLHGEGPLLLAYKGPSGFYIRFQTFSGSSGASRTSSSTATTTPRLSDRRWCTARWPTSLVPTAGSSCITTWAE